MRLRGVVMLGALVVGASACGDAVAPAAHAAADLEFAAPAVRRGGPESEHYKSWDRPVSEAEAARLMGVAVTKGGAGDASLEGEEERLLPLIFETYVTGEYVEDRLYFRYGLLGAGTGYTMTPFVEITAADGSSKHNAVAMGRTEEAPFYFVFAPSVEEMVPAGAGCGTDAWIGVRYEVRSLKPPIMGGGASKTEQSRSTIARQARCTTPGSGGGGVTIGVDEGFQICYYELWVDGNGNVVDVFFIGCRSYSGSNAY